VQSHVAAATWLDGPNRIQIIDDSKARARHETMVSATGSSNFSLIQLHDVMQLFRI
jgi:hypothetical protein